MIGGLEHCSLIDFPGHLAAVIFTQGCDLRCRYCHNPELISRSCSPSQELGLLWRFLDSRKGLLTGVVVTGGEPTLHGTLPTLLRGIRARGFATKLDTNGMHPDVVRKLVSLKLVDYVAVDVKMPPEACSSHLCGTPNQGALALATLGVLCAAGVEHEARTTVVHEVHSAGHLEAIADALLVGGVSRWVLQVLQPTKQSSPSVGLTRPNRSLLCRASEAAAKRGLITSVRGLEGALPH